MVVEANVGCNCPVKGQVMAPCHSMAAVTDGLKMHAIPDALLNCRRSHNRSSGGTAAGHAEDAAGAAVGAEGDDEDLVDVDGDFDFDDAGTPQTDLSNVNGAGQNTCLLTHTL